ncbi:head GIN domain-containing protein [Tenacibaculum piscium]|uniref:head GIN domain-containing protein n=1 Tax=Tenacibaculum piscium TaxID=1458515 RepID=UPI001F30A7D2|nr:head GIN domain-containing protein [Tenacibaculum piscium]
MNINVSSIKTIDKTTDKGTAKTTGMIKKIIFLSLLLMPILASAQTTITTTLGDFSKVKVFNGIDVYLVKSAENKVVITGDKSEKVIIKNKNKTLKISLQFPETTADGTVKITLYYAAALKIIDANEGAIITTKLIEQPQIEIKAQEGAFINMVVNVKHLKVKTSSGAVIKLSGTAKNQTVDANLGGMYHGYKVTVTDLNYVRAGSGAKVEVNSGETLDAKVSFGGSIFYKGTPEIVKEKKVIGGVIEHRI